MKAESSSAAELLAALRAEGTLERETLDRDYNARATVTAEHFNEEMRRYRQLSQPARAMNSATLDVVYDEISGQTLDIFGAAEPGESLKPVFLFVHGGYWRALSKLDSSFMAPALAKHGIATAVLDYRLAPAVSLGEIVREVRQAIAFLWRRGAHYGINPQRIFAGGSSAGGHLTGMLLANGWQANAHVPENVIKGALAISGLFHLAPIAASFVQDWISLTPQQVTELSPAEDISRMGCPLIVAFAAQEATGFGRQSRTYHKLWREAGHECDFMEIPNRNHFDVVLDLADPETKLSRALVELVRLG
ncbi:alpha/beta hydrolase [Nitratireductor aquimarinus]|uniref:alpha/beta hydrolase n=1 Tax=Nitratireductor aquimarinus TaxID=889300 RepID=UPI002935E0A5|nr:alpha/beta hydrolase [Nitratireductor aquimarinus]MDV2966684.1 alpha/beta hydrolase [Nitratireductor aquimarinus]